MYFNLNCDIIVFAKPSAKIDAVICAENNILKVIYDYLDAWIRFDVYLVWYFLSTPPEACLFVESFRWSPEYIFVH